MCFRKRHWRAHRANHGWHQYLSFLQRLWSVIQALIHPNKLRKRVHRACNGEEVKKTLMPWVSVFSKVVSALWVFDHIFRVSLNLQRVHARGHDWCLCQRHDTPVALSTTDLWHWHHTSRRPRGTHPGPAPAQFVYQSRFRVGNILLSPTHLSKHTWMSQWALYKSWGTAVRVAAAPVVFYVCV